MRDGDQAAIASFIDRLSCVPRIVAAVNSKLGRPLGREECDDVAQEALMAVWKKIDQFDGRAQLQTWVYPFCYFETLRRLRKRRRDPLVLDDSIEGSEIEPATAPARSTEDHERVLRELDALEPEISIVIRLKLFEDLTFDVIGERLGISPNTAKGRYYRGVRKLNQSLGKNTQRGAAGGQA